MVVADEEEEVGDEGGDDSNPNRDSVLDSLAPAAGPDRERFASIWLLLLSKKRYLTWGLRHMSSSLNRR
jgi:hypothetical protein